jgi:NAD(P)-dependent dehydrogenase (short-subunit alcohol dehydrogenase family)
MRFANRVALVTGGSSGIGEATARAFAKEGAAVGVLGTNREAVERVKYDIESAGGSAVGIIADVSQPHDVQRAVQETVNAFGGLDIVFANAGINGVWAPVDELEPDEWDKTLDINLKGTYLTVRYAVPHMRQNGGCIIVTSSVNGTRMFSNAGASAYASSKAAQVAFTKMVALELAKYKIRVNVICPGAIETPIQESTEKRSLEKAQEPVDYPDGEIPLTDGEPGTAQQVADLVLFLASDAAQHISGTEIWIDGAQSLLQG